MAEIPVHKKSSLAWLWWLLGLLLLALLLWWLLSDDDERDVVAEPVATEQVVPLEPVDNTMIADPVVTEPVTEPTHR